MLVTRGFETGSTVFQGSSSTLGRGTANTLCDWHLAKIPNSRDSVPGSGYNSSIAEASRDREVHLHTPTKFGEDRPKDI